VRKRGRPEKENEEEEAENRFSTVAGIRGRNEGTVE
jgi:hypothetical protein